MKLPPDFDIKTLSQLKGMVEHINSRIFDGFDALGKTLEMSEEQYVRYKELVWREDPMRFYNGMKIQVTKKEP